MHYAVAAAPAPHAMPYMPLHEFVPMITSKMWYAEQEYAEDDDLVVKKVFEALAGMEEPEAINMLDGNSTTLAQWDTDTMAIAMAKS